MTISKLSFINLPNEIITNIFYYLDVKDLISSSEVCKSWKVISRNSSLWKDYFCRDFFYYEKNIESVFRYFKNFSAKGIKKFVYAHLATGSPSDLACRLHFNKAILNENKRYTITNLLTFIYRPIPNKYLDGKDFYNAYCGKISKLFFHTDINYKKCPVDVFKENLIHFSTILNYATHCDKYPVTSLHYLIKKTKTRKFFQIYNLWNTVQKNKFLIRSLERCKIVFLNPMDFLKKQNKSPSIHSSFFNIFLISLVCMQILLIISKLYGCSISEFKKNGINFFRTGV